MSPGLLALKVLLLAGGGSAETNDHSHLTHIEQLRGVLRARGVHPDHVAVFWADGAEPGPDRAVRRESELPGSWLVEGTPLDEPLRPEAELHDTRFDDVAVHPATRDALRRWLGGGARFAPGDALLIAVTDHGVPDPTGQNDTRVVLWGMGWSVSEATEDLELVPADVRVVIWMSQCFSGGFARLAIERPDTCGIFSANPNDPSYGCFSEMDRPGSIGHFQRVVDALARHADLGSASDEAMLTDDMPDTPHRSSDVFLHDALAALAAERGVPLSALVDPALASVPADPPKRRLIADITTAYGLGEIAGVGDALAHLRRLRGLGRAAGDARDHWRALLHEARGHLTRTLSPTSSHIGADAATRKAERARLVAAARAEAAKTPGLVERLEAIRGRESTADSLVARNDTYMSAVRRVGYLLLRQAAPLLDPPARARWEALRRCEETPLWPPVAAVSPPLTAPSPLPPVSDHAAAIEAATPAFLGMRYRETPDGVALLATRPGSPAERLPAEARLAGAGGVDLAAPGAFAQVVALAPVGVALPVRLTDGAVHELAPVRRPPKHETSPGAPLPALSVVPLEGEGRLTVGDRPTVLYFWASWCKQCERATPMLDAWARGSGARVVAVSVESREKAKAHLASNPMPSTFEQWVDAENDAGGTLALEGYPAMLLVDRDGRIAAVQVGLPLRGRIPEAWGRHAADVTTLR